MIAVVLRLDRRRDETPGTEYRRTDALGIAHARVTDAVLDINQISASSRPTGYS